MIYANEYERLKLNRQNTLKKSVPNKPGLYIMYNKNGKPIYVGHASRLRHRVQSYRQTDCYKEHPTKKALRSKATHFMFDVMPKKKAQRIERSIKKEMKYNCF